MRIIRADFLVVADDDMGKRIMGGPGLNSQLGSGPSATVRANIHEEPQEVIQSLSSGKLSAGKAAWGGDI